MKQQPHKPIELNQSVKGLGLFKLKLNFKQLKQLKQTETKHN